MSQSSKSGKLFVISAPSGSGKTSLTKGVLRYYKDICPFKQAVTSTTRSPRKGEVDGRDYNFLSIDQFKADIQDNKFLDWSTWYDHYYGSPSSLLEEIKLGVSFILIVDRSGAREIKKVYPESILIWVEPPSLEELEVRLRARGKDSEATIVNRLKKASVEMEEEEQERLYTYKVVNDMFDETVKKLIIIFEKEINR
jgi:guanylate kinase